jgi:hypothetical protein
MESETPVKFGATDRKEGKERSMKKLVLSLMLAFAVIGGAIAITAVISTHVVAGQDGGAHGG